MSTGHPHHRPNKLAHTRELGKLLANGGALMRRWNKVDIDHDIPYLGGYNVDGTVRFADRDFVRCLHDPAFAEQILGLPVDTGLHPLDTLECVLWHEAVEKVLLDADNPINTYEDAHEYATAAEHDKVREKGSTPIKYERGLERIIKHCMSKPLQRVPADYACAPMLEHPDATDKRLVKTLRRLGVADASKVSKASVHYGLSTGLTHCSICSMWNGSQNQALAKCDLVDGLVRDKYGCDRFEPANNPAAAPHLDMNAHAKWRRSRRARLQRSVQH